MIKMQTREDKRKQGAALIQAAFNKRYVAAALMEEADADMAAGRRHADHLTLVRK